MNLQSRTFTTPDDTMRFPNGSLDVITFDEAPLRQLTVQPGWRWSNDVRPLGSDQSCQVAHEGFMLSGNLHVEMDDGSTLDIGPNELFQIPPGHDAWVAGNEACGMVDWGARVPTDTHTTGGQS